MTTSEGILQTERLILTRLRPAHVPALVDLWTDPEVTRHMGGPRERVSLAADLEKDARNPPPGKFDLWVLVEKATGDVVGHCGLLDKDVEGAVEIELVYVLAASAWGKGYATEIAAGLKHYAFGDLGLKRLISLIEPSNSASERVAIKTGMHLEREIIRPGGGARRLYAIEAEGAPK
jgi:ribosomal-protein-alanine N-acetyltransferase